MLSVPSRGQCLLISEDQASEPNGHCSLPVSLYLADLRGVLQQLAGVEAIPVLDEVVPQAAVGQVLHDEPQVPASCTVEKHRSCIIVGAGESP